MYDIKSSSFYQYSDWDAFLYGFLKIFVAPLDMFAFHFSLHKIQIQI